MVLFLMLGKTFVDASRAKKKAKKRDGKLLDGLFEKIRGDDAIAVADILKAEPQLLNSKGGGGQTPLMASVLMGSAKCAEYLLSLGADTSIPEKDGYTPMHGAGFQGRAEIAKLLIKEGLDPNIVHKDGYSPVHRAAWGMEQRHTDTVKVFVEAGVAVCDLVASNGHTAMSMTGNPKTRSFLESFCSGRGHYEGAGRELQAMDDDQAKESVTAKDLHPRKSMPRAQIQQGFDVTKLPGNQSTKSGKRRKKGKGKRKHHGGGRGGEGGLSAKKASRKVADDDDDT